MESNEQEALRLLKENSFGGSLDDFAALNQNECDTLLTTLQPNFASIGLLRRVWRARQTAVPGLERLRISPNVVRVARIDRGRVVYCGFSGSGDDSKISVSVDELREFCPDAEYLCRFSENETPPASARPIYLPAHGNVDLEGGVIWLLQGYNSSIFDSFTSLSHVTVCDRVANGLQDAAKISLPTVFKESQRLWNLLPDSIRAPESHIESEYQIVMQELLQFIGQHSTGGVLKFFPKVTLAQLVVPKKVPDFILTRPAIVSPTWYDVCVPIEVEPKGNFKEGTGQAASYLSCAVSSQKRHQGIAIYSDCHEIVSICCLKKIEQVVWHIEHMQLLPSIHVGADKGRMTQGFDWLVQLLHSADYSTLMAPPQPAIQLPLELLCQADRLVHIATGGSSWVLRDLQNDRVIKVAKPGRESLLETEFNIYQKFSNQCDHLLSLQDGSNATMLIFECVVDVPTMHLVDPLLKRSVGVLGLHIHSALSFLWNNGYVHSDVRPLNLAFKSPNFILIDLGSSVVKTKAASSDRAISWYAPNAQLQSQSSGQQWVPDPLDDLESLFYCMYYFVHGSIPWHNAPGSLQAKVDKRENHFKFGALDKCWRAMYAKFDLRRQDASAVQLRDVESAFHDLCSSL